LAEEKKNRLDKLATVTEYGITQLRRNKRLWHSKCKKKKKNTIRPKRDAK
jgi:hypothetical protein